VRAPGRIRPARRPAGWRAPGPAPRPPRDIHLAPGPDEDLCWLAGDWRIFQRVDGHRWSVDDLVTAWFAACAVAVTPPRSHLDLGCGIGAVLLLLSWRFPEVRALGIEAQDVSVELACRSLAWNGIDARARVLHGDLRDADVLPAGEQFDLVTGTPPYLAPGAATASTRVQRGPCHIAYRGGMAEYSHAAARWLAPEGRFVACEAAGRGPGVVVAAARAGLTVERRLDVVPREGKDALFSVYAMRRADGTSPPIVETPLVVRNANGRWTPAFLEVRREMGMPP